MQYRDLLVKHQTNLTHISNLEKLFISYCEPYLLILLGYFNTKSKFRSIHDTVTGKGTIFENLTSLYLMKQLISALTHILQHFWSCINLISVFTHHCTKTVIIKLYFANLIWKLRLWKGSIINCEIDQFYWVNRFLDKNINEQVISNFIQSNYTNHLPYFYSKQTLFGWMAGKIPNKKITFQKDNESNTFYHVSNDITLALSNAQNVMKDLQLNLMIPNLLQKPAG